MTYEALIRDALLELGAIDVVDPTPPELLELGRVRFNGIINQRNANQLFLYAVEYPEYTTTAGLLPHTIGPDSATWNATARPVSILGANQYQGSGTGLVKMPINIRDRNWWMRQQLTPNITTGVVTDLYYEPTWRSSTDRNGDVYLWPVPTGQVTIQLEVTSLVTEIDADELANEFSLPFGYQRDLTCELAIDLSGPLTLPVSPELQRKANKATSIVQAVNNQPVRIRTAPIGLGGDRGGGFNWINRSWNN